MMAASALPLYAWQIEPFWLEFVHLDMAVHNLPEHMEGKTLMQISDLHVGNRFDYKFISESLRKAKAFRPDFVCYTGDYISYESEEQYGQLSEVMQDVLLGQIATIGILGNHDYGINWSHQSVSDKIENILSDAGIEVLRNRSILKAGINFIGLDDYWSPNFDAAIISQAFSENIPNITLCHNPDVIDLPVWGGFRGWILSGHTHGGQCKPPFLKPPMLPVKNKNLSAGIYTYPDGRKLYINRALGHLWQVRFNVRPEITIFTLKNA